MKKDIYKITNLINKKVYIGQSTDVNRRFRERYETHKQDSVSKINLAIRKYGKENFSFEVIEHQVENYNEREKYWISYYKSNNRKYGYNITEGGEDPPIISGDKSFFAVYTEDVINRVKNDLINTNLSFDEIAKIYNVNSLYITFINRGITRHDSSLSYPLRPHQNVRSTKEKITEIIDLLSTTHLSVLEIARMLNASPKLINKVNIGKHFYSPSDINYPIRLPNESISQAQKELIIQDLRDRKLKFTEIEKKYSIPKVTLSRFNNGKIWKVDNIKYPIRKSSERVY